VQQVRVLFATAAALLLGLPATSSALPRCADPLPAPHVLLQTGDSLEYGAVDARGRLFYSDTTKSALMRAEPGGAPTVLAQTPADPGAFVMVPGNAMVVGIGDQVQNGLQGDANPISSLWRVDLDSGAHSVYADGLGEANGLAVAPDGAFYATNGVGSYVDRVVGGHVEHGWAKVFSTNGVAVSGDNRFVYVSQTLAPAAVQRIPLANPRDVTPYFKAQGNDRFAGLDDMTIDPRGRLFVAANEAGQLWRVDGPGRACLLASGLDRPSAAVFGLGPYSRNLYVVTFGGSFLEYRDVLPATPNARCRDRQPPRSRFGLARLTAHRVRLSGRSADAGCAGLKRVDVSLALLGRGGGCRFLTHSGHLGRVRSCCRPVLFEAHGRRHWTFVKSVRLPSGRYRAVAEAVDRAGNRERAGRLNRRSLAIESEAR
jgi:gluconolactonase